jgi:hypothetical protein
VNHRLAVGDEIVRDNNDRRHRSYVHESCKPAAGIYTRAGFRVEVRQADEKGYIPVGTHKQYVRESMAQAVAEHWRQLGAKEVVVIAL